MSPKYHSLALDETVKDLDIRNDFEPDLKVIINAHYHKSSHGMAASANDVVQISGRITVSF